MTSEPDDLEFERLTAPLTDVKHAAAVAEFELPTDPSGEPRPEDAIAFPLLLIMDVAKSKLLASAFWHVNDHKCAKGAAYIHIFVEQFIRDSYMAAKAAVDEIGPFFIARAVEHGWTSTDGWPEGSLDAYLDSVKVEFDDE